MGRGSGFSIIIINTQILFQWDLGCSMFVLIRDSCLREVACFFFMFSVLVVAVLDSVILAVW